MGLRGRAASWPAAPDLARAGPGTDPPARESRRRTVSRPPAAPGPLRARAASVRHLVTGGGARRARLPRCDRSRAPALASQPPHPGEAHCRPRELRRRFYLPVTYRPPSGNSSSLDFRQVGNPMRGTPVDGLLKSGDDRVKRIPSRLAVRWAVAVLALVALLALPAGRAQAQTPDSLAAQIAELKGQIDGMNEQVQALQSRPRQAQEVQVLGLRPGALGDRGEQERLREGAAATRPRSRRRTTNASTSAAARLKLTYDSARSARRVVYLDGGAGPHGPPARGLRHAAGPVDAAAPRTRAHDRPDERAVRLRDRALLERARAARALARRERAVPRRARPRRQARQPVDRRSSRPWSAIAQRRRASTRRLPEHRSDPRARTSSARVRWSQGMLDVAVSYYRGASSTAAHRARRGAPTRRASAPTPRATTQLPALGGGTLQGEFYAGHETQPRLGEDAHRHHGAGRAARRRARRSTHLATDFAGGYVMWVQNLGEQLAARAPLRQVRSQHRRRPRPVRAHRRRR